MKNLFKGAFLIIMIMITQPSQSKSLNRTSGLTNGSGTMDAAEAQKLISRLEEIKAMNRSTPEIASLITPKMEFFTMMRITFI